MRIVSVVPARGGSKGVPGKNIRELCGQPLIAYSILDSLRVKDIEETYVSTDCDNIARESLKFGAEIVWRPEQYATDTSPDIEWVTHFLQWFYKKYEYHPEYIVHLRATTPFRDLNFIREAIRKIKKNPSATSLISLEADRSEPYKSFHLNGDYLEPLFDIRYHLMPRQSFPTVYTPNGYVDILKTETILRGDLHGGNILGFITPKVPEIDNEEDLEYASFLGEKYLNL